MIGIMSEIKFSIILNEDIHQITAPSTRSNFEEMACDDYIDMMMDHVKAELVKQYRYFERPQVTYANTEINECEGCDL